MLRSDGDNGADSPASAQARANLFYGLAAASRIALCLELADGEMRVKNLAAATGLTRSNTSYQLGYLWDAGLVARERRGTGVVYRLIPGALELLEAADRVLARAAIADGASDNPGGGHKREASARSSDPDADPSAGGRLPPARGVVL